MGVDVVRATNLNTDLTTVALSQLDATAGLVEQTGADAFTKRAIGVGASTSIPTRADADARYLTQTAGDTAYQPKDTDLTTWAGLTPSANFQLLIPETFAQMQTSLFLVPGTDVFKQRTITGPAAGITFSNGDGVSGNPTLALANDLSALEALSSTGIAVRTASDTWAQRSLGGVGLAVASNPAGIAGDPTITVTAASDAEAQAQTSTTKALTPSNLAGRASFGANKNGTSQTSIATATFTKVTFTTEGWDVGSYYDATNSKWVPPAGKVRISVTLDVQNSSLTIISIYKNGVEWKRGARIGQTTETQYSAVCTTNDNANGTDYYEVYIFCTTVGGGTVVGSIVTSYFEGEQA